MMSVLRVALICLSVLILLTLGCSKSTDPAEPDTSSDDRSTAETISIPDRPSGPSSGEVGEGLEYTTGGASSNLDHPIVYRFVWGDGTSSAWNSTPRASRAYATAGTFEVFAEARCADHPHVGAVRSECLSVTIGASTHTVSVPTTPTGATFGSVNHTYTYNTGGAVCSHGHAVQFRFTWGVWPPSDWSNAPAADYAWAAAGTYLVRAQARCTDQTGIESDWSEFLTVIIQ
jgi:hypothetical protein